MLDVSKQHNAAPFDTERLDRLMDDAGIDVLLATSKHNVQYLLGGHRAFFFESMDAMGLSRYLPVSFIPRASRRRPVLRPPHGELSERGEAVLGLGDQHQELRSVDAMEKAVDYLRRLAPKPKCIGVELAFIPADAMAVLRRAFPDAESRMRCSCWSGCVRARPPRA